MKTKFSRFLTLILAFVVQITFAQQQSVTGTVADEDGLPLPGVNIIIKGTTTGVQSDFDGNYAIQAAQGDVLVFSFIGLKKAEYPVGASAVINVTLEADAAQLSEVVVTALGIKREKKSLGYATQEVDGSEVSDVPTTNFMNSLSGKVAGLNIKSSGTIGGSSNVIIRGNASLTGNNQALFVVDGTPISNANTNTSDQKTGRGGYDFGNAAADIDPNNIASINVLKGAAATALYGSRASNGVVIITTKRGSKGKGIGVSVSSSLMISNADKETLPKYQKEYGAGYGPYYDSEDGYFNLYDVDGDGTLDETTPFTEDASFGAKFDPNRLVYQWNSIYPQLDTYQQATPWVAGEHTPNDIWGTGYTAINSVALDGGSDTGSFRLSANNTMQEGNLPNSEIKRNTISFSGSQELSDKLTANASVTFTKTDGKGRYGTGYDSSNPMQQFRQWSQTNVDLFEQRDAYFATGENITWNPNSPDNLAPIYSDNPYWTRYENYETDTRNRYFGNLGLEYEINDIFSVVGRFSYDTYDELQEERINVGSADVAKYSRFNNRVAEYNYDLILNFNKDLTEDLNLDGNIGANLRRNSQNSIYMTTNGGLNAPGFYALSNSAGPLVTTSFPDPDTEYDGTSMIDGVYARAGLGYLSTYYLEGTIRRDRSSTLPIANNTFWYPSVSTSIILSNLIDATWLQFTKLRANYAEVGSDTNRYNVFNTYAVTAPFGTAGYASNNAQLNNRNLKPERSKSYEIGLEADFLNKRIGFDVSYYRTKTEDQITPVPVSNATGFVTKFLNAGVVENKGIEVLLRLTPIKTEDFNWNMTVNWAKNENEVLELTDGIDNLQLASLQGGISINASPGQPYGAIRGTNYLYDNAGNRVITSAGYYAKTPTNNQIIGNIQPDWTGGVQNTLNYKNLSLAFLIDVQKGGDIFSLDTWYGFATGLYDQSVGLNDLGNPKRNSIADGGGVLLDGVNADVVFNDDGTYTVSNETPNTTRARTDYYANPFGYARDANAGHVYDASFVKLREASLTYDFGEKMIGALPITSASLSLIGRNLWIIDKNIPYSDPEAGLSSGNVQGYQSGAYPTIREIGASVKINF